MSENGTPVGTYSYDLNGNQTGTGYHTTIMNEMANSPGNTYTYDKAGSLISDQDGSTVTTYIYDYENRLTGVEQNGTIIATYTYDALNRRIGVKDSGTQTWTVYDGTSADAEPYADFNGSGSLTERYLTGKGVVNGAVVDQLLAREGNWCQFGRKLVSVRFSTWKNELTPISLQSTTRAATCHQRPAVRTQIPHRRIRRLLGHWIQSPNVCRKLVMTRDMTDRSPPAFVASRFRN